MKKIVVLLICFLFVEASAQFNGRRFSLSFNGVYTTSARLYLQPYASDEAVRNNSLPLENIYSIAAELRYSLTESILLGLGSEYMKSTDGNSSTVVFYQGALRSITVEDGFSLIPIELSAYYILPFSGDKFKFLIGGGAGYYYGNHIRKLGDTYVSTTHRKFAYGIHVSVSSDYMINKFLSIRAEMKFRDPQFTITNSYNKQEAAYNGNTIRLLQKSFDSKINIDGVTFIAGIAVHL